MVLQVSGASPTSRQDAERNQTLLASCRLTALFGRVGAQTGPTLDSRLDFKVQHTTVVQENLPEDYYGETARENLAKGS